MLERSIWNVAHRLAPG